MSRTPKRSVRHNFVYQALHTADPSTRNVGRVPPVVVACLKYPSRIDGPLIEAAESSAPCAGDWVSGSTIFNCSTTDPPSVRDDSRQRIFMFDERE